MPRKTKNVEHCQVLLQRTSMHVRFSGLAHFRGSQVGQALIALRSPGSSHESCLRIQAVPVCPENCGQSERYKQLLRASRQLNVYSVARLQILVSMQSHRQRLSFKISKDHKLHMSKALHAASGQQFRAACLRKDCCFEGRQGGSLTSLRIWTFWTAMSIPLSCC